MKLSKSRIIISEDRLNQIATNIHAGMIYRPQPYFLNYPDKPVIICRKDSEGKLVEHKTGFLTIGYGFNIHPGRGRGLTKGECLKLISMRFPAHLKIGDEFYGTTALIELDGVDYMKLLVMICEDEGLRPYPYLDDMPNAPVFAASLNNKGELVEDRTDLLYIGCSFLIEPSGRLKMGGLNEKEAYEMLNLRVRTIHDHHDVQMVMGTVTNKVRQAVIIMLAYNNGIFGMMQFKKMRLAMERGDWQVAHDEILDSKAARKHEEWGNPRYKTLALMMLTGEWPE